MEENPYQPPADAGQAATPGQPIKAAAKLLIFGGIFVGAVVLMYRQRCLGDSLWDSDFLMFYLPPVVGLLANGLIIGTSLPSKWGWIAWGVVTSGVAILLTIMEVWGQLAIAFTVYGT